MEVNRKRKICKKIAGYADHKYVGQAGISHRGYVGGTCGTVMGDAWYCSRPS